MDKVNHLLLTMPKSQIAWTDFYSVQAIWLSSGWSYVISYNDKVI